MTGAVLITGAGRGLGAALALGAAAKGYPVVGVGRDAQNLGVVARAVTAAGGSFTSVVGDARDSAVLAAAVDSAELLPGGLYGVIANAGIAGPTSPVQELSDEDWDETIDVNLTAVFRLCREALPPLLVHGRGRIVLVGSVTGKRPLSGRAPYAASKLGVVGLARTLAVEVGRQGITVNVVSPWLLEGERLENVIHKQATLGGRSEEQLRQELVAGTATGRTVSDDDVVATVEFLLDSRSSSLTGQDFNVAAGAVMY
jgi:NAD(P)-dependent dehydrogenase (short-subunit alcohol dehydrogenase family)